jgi:hypothetical protein
VVHDLHAPPEPGEPAWHYASFMFFGSPAVADLDGDGRNEIAMASAIAGSSPRRGKVWIARSEGKGAGPWPMFKLNEPRTSALGGGSSSHFAAPAPAAVEAPRPAPRVVRRAPASTVRPTTKPTVSPSVSVPPEVTDPPMLAPEIFAAPQVEEESPPNRLPLVVAGMVGVAAAAAGVLALKRRRTGADALQ